MPNWCENELFLEGPTKWVQDVWTRAHVGENAGLLEALVPMPTALRGTTSPPYPKDSPHYKPQPYVDGHNNWYDWCVANWGTKWDVDTEGLELTVDGDRARITGWFNSAWAPPLECMQRVIEANEDVDIKVTYMEGGMDFAGEWHNGSDESISLSDYKSDDYLQAEEGLLAQLNAYFGIGEHMAENEAIEEAENNLK